VNGSNCHSGQPDEIGLCGVGPPRKKKPPENPPPGMKTALAWKIVYDFYLQSHNNVVIWNLYGAWSVF
jgi:hypothetical protein